MFNYSNPETKVSDDIDRVGTLRFAFGKASELDSLANAATDLWGVYYGTCETGFTARYLAGEILGIGKAKLDSQATSWIEDLRQKGTSVARVDLDFMTNYLPDKRNRIAASDALGKNRLVTRFFEIFNN